MYENCTTVTNIGQCSYKKKFLNKKENIVDLGYIYKW